MAVPGDVVEGLAAKFAVMRPLLDERQWRAYLGSEARALGHGGIAAVARAAGVAVSTVAAGVSEVEAGHPALERGRSRRPGGGRKKAEDLDAGLMPALRGLVEPATRGDPVRPVTWTTLSLRDLEREMAAAGHPCGKDAIARILREMGYSLRGAAKVLEGSQHPGRDAQFEYINAMIGQFIAAGDPVISVDGKKKEQLGGYWRAGSSWRPPGEPVKVRDHSFPDLAAGIITPYGVYDVAANRGFVSVGTSHSTAAFAVNAIGLWWRGEGQARYPRSRRMLVTCDAGGSNACSSRNWVHELALLAAAAGLEVTVCHFPPGTSKWNRIEHRVFCHITRTWRGRPLMTIEDAVAGIAATTTFQGLKCTAVIDGAAYPKGREVSGERMRHLEDRVLQRHREHGDWNYTVLPAPRPAPPPAPQPGPGQARRAMLAHPALTGITPADLADLARTLEVPFRALREQHAYARRGGHRKKAAPATAPRGLGVTDHLIALRLRQHAGLPPALIACLLGVDRTTISHATTQAWQLITRQRITLPPPAAPAPATPILSPADLAAYATANDITINIPDTKPTQKWPKYAKRWRPPPTTHLS
jgi:hypothetical protein